MKIRRQDERAVPASTKMRTHAKERASGKDEGYEIIMAQCKRLKLYMYTYVYIAYVRARDYSPEFLSENSADQKNSGQYANDFAHEGASNVKNTRKFLEISRFQLLIPKFKVVSGTLIAERFLKRGRKNVKKRKNARNVSIYRRAGIFAFLRDPAGSRAPFARARTHGRREAPTFEGRKEHDGGCKVHSSSAAPLSCAIRMTRVECAPTSKAPTAPHSAVPLVRARARVQERQKRKRKRKRERERERCDASSSRQEHRSIGVSHTQANACPQHPSASELPFLSPSLSLCLARSLSLSSTDSKPPSRRFDRVAKIRYC